MARNHTAWLKARLETIAGATGQVFVSKAEYAAPNQGVKLTYPYWVIHPADGVDEATRETGPKITQHPRFTIHSVGENADQAAWAGAQVKALLVVSGFGVVPTITGERCKPFWYHSPVPIQTDSSVLPVVCFHVAEASFATEPV